MDEVREYTLEENFEKLEGMIEKLEEGEMALDEAFKLYTEGMKVLQKCNEQIDRVEKQVIILSQNEI